MTMERSSSFHGSTHTVVEESIFTRFIIAPILCVAFLISLFFIDRETVGGVFGRKAQSGTYYHSHQKKLAKHDLDEAFRRKNKVIAILAGSAAVGLALAGWLVERGYLYLTKR